MDNTKKNKGKIIAIIVAILVVIIAAVAIFAAIKLSNKNDKKEEQKNTSYHKEQIEDFVKACKSKEDMEKFVKENVNLKAYYAMSVSQEPENFEEEYKNAKSEDYENEEFIDNVVDTFETYVDEENNIEIKDIEELKDIEKDNSVIGQVLSEIKGIKVAKFTMLSDEIEISAFAYLYDERIFIVAPDFTSMGSEYVENN